MPMKRARIILMLGVWVAILPYLGFPSSWKNVLFTLTGLVFTYFSYILYKEFKASTKGKDPQTFDNFSENNTFHSNMREAANENTNA